jgi:hypothetical protein
MRKIHGLIALALVAVALVVLYDTTGLGLVQRAECAKPCTCDRRTPAPGRPHSLAARASDTGLPASSPLAEEQ